MLRPSHFLLKTGGKYQEMGILSIQKVRFGLVMNQISQNFQQVISILNHLLPLLIDGNKSQEMEIGSMSKAEIGLEMNQIFQVTLFQMLQNGYRNQMMLSKTN